MRSLSISLTMFCFALTARAQQPAPPDYQKRIQDLEARLAVVEGQLEALLRERATPPIEAPAPSPAPPTTVSEVAPRHYAPPPELIPEVGKLGAEVGVLASASANPFHLDSGSFFGGFVDLPLIDRPEWLHGKLSYEIAVGLSRSSTRVTTTSNVAQIANLAALTALNPNDGLANVVQAFSGTGSAPFPVTSQSRLDLRLLQIVPFSLKYTTTALDRWRLRPYGLIGFGMYVTLHREVPIDSTGVRADADLPPAVLNALRMDFGSSAPFGNTLVAGQLGQASQLSERGVPSGSGNLDVGLQTGGGLEFRVSPSLSFGFDGRFNKISGSNSNFGTYGSRIAIHF